MNGNMKDFLKKLSGNKELAEKAAKLDKEGLIALAKELGFELTEADFVQPDGAVSDDELEVVTGGDACYCAMGGGGTDGEKDNLCVCPLVGAGMYTGDDEDGGPGPWARCCCPMVGYGRSADD